MIKELFYILVFPGFLFVSIFGMAAEFMDRKLYARFQNRIGPPWFQPLADFIKLLGKENIVPAQANPRMFKAAPLFALTAAVTAYLYIPLWRSESLLSFNGDIIVVLYLLTIPTLAFFVGGWYSTSLFARIGSVRMVTQLFAYEVPLFMSVLSSALLANTWSISKLMMFYNEHPWFWLINLPGFAISLVSFLGKMEKVPFDIPEAETEIVAGGFVEYSGRLLAYLKLTLNIEMIAGASLFAAVFLPFGLNTAPAAGFIIYIAKVIFIVFLIALLHTVFARMRMDQMINFCWKYMVPVAILQLLANMALKGIIL